MSCPQSLTKPAPGGLPDSMFNFSYSSLFPKPYCSKCGYGYNSKDLCTNMEPYQDVLKKAALLTSGDCPYGHVSLPGIPGCNSLLSGAFRAPEDSVVINGQITQIAPRRNTSICVPCNTDKNLGCSSCY